MCNELAAHPEHEPETERDKQQRDGEFKQREPGRSDLLLVVLLEQQPQLPQGTHHAT